MELEIVDLGMNGEGVGRLDGKVILVPNALPTERVEVEIKQDFGNYAVAKLVNINRKSTHRRIPPCEYSECGGCELMHMSYDLQLKFKHDLVHKTIKKIANIECEVADTVPSDRQLGFRNKVSYSCVNTDFGMKRANSREVVNIDKCWLATDRQNEIFSLFRQYCKDHNLLGYDVNTGKGVIKNLVIRDFMSGILVAVVTSRYIDINEFYSILKDKYDNIGLYEVINNRKDSVVISGKVSHIGGIKDIKLNEYGLIYPIDILAFHQTNNYIQNEIYNKMLEYINNDEIVVNGFSGAGVLSAIIAKRAKHVYGIEIELASHKSAEILRTENNIDNLTNICADFTKEYIRLSRTLPTHTLVLDPSKKGCGDIVKTINGANKIIYLSCNPIALAKDLRNLTKYYIIDNVIPYDMFPNTVSVETLVILKKR